MGFEPHHPTSITISRNTKCLPRTYILLWRAQFVSGCSGTRAFVVVLQLLLARRTTTPSTGAAAPCSRWSPCTTVTTPTW